MAETVSRGRKFTTIEELEMSDKGPVWVLNNTRDNLEGKVVVSIPKKNGNGADVIRVPKSFIPFDLTQQVSRSQLMDSSDFRKTVGNRLLKLVTPEYATLLLSTDEAKDEIQRVRNDEQKAKMLLKRAGVVNDSAGVGEDDEDEYFDAGSAKKSQAKNKKTVKVAADSPAAEEAAAPKVKKEPSMKVQNIVASNKTSAETTIVAKLKNVNLKKVDLAYLSREYKNKPRVMKFLKKTLEDKRAAEAA